MYRNACQRGLLTILHSGGTNPLAIWDVYAQDGWISRFLDPDIKSMVLEIGGNNVSTSYITCPKGKKVLGIAMPFLVMVVKNLKKYFSFEVTILDDTGVRRRFRASNFQSTTQILPLCTAMPICLTDGWNQIQFNLAEFTRRAYKKQYAETLKVKINANIRIRRVYFAERLVPEDQLPAEYKLFFPVPHKRREPKRPTLVEPPPAIEEKKTSKASLVKTRSKASVHSLKADLSVARGSQVKTSTEEVKEEVLETLVEGVKTETDLSTVTEGIAPSEVDGTEEALAEETDLAKEPPKAEDVEDSELPVDAIAEDMASLRTSEEGQVPPEGAMADDTVPIETVDKSG